jgi:hypothetical protein
MFLWRTSSSAALLAKGIHRTGTLLMTTSVAIVGFVNNPCHRHIGLRPLEDFVNDTEKSRIQAFDTSWHRPPYFVNGFPH